MPRTIPQAVELAATRFGAVEAMVDGDERWTFADLAERVDVAARAFIASGVVKGDRIAIWAQNMAGWAVAALGVHRAGAAVVPLNTRFKGSEAAYILEASGARMLFTVTDFLDTDYVSMLPPELRPAALEEIVVLRGPTGDGTTAWSSFLARAEQVGADAGQERSDSIAPDELSDILFTSGTTGKPKGAMLHHEASVRAFTAWSDVIGLQEGDRYLIINPFFHAFGLKAGILASVLKGATMIPHPVFDVPSVMRRVAEERVSMLPGPPAIYQTILDHPDLGAHDLSSLRLAVTGAAPVPVEMIRRMREELTFEAIVTGYGLTEATGIATMCRHDDEPETISATAGRAIPDIEVLVVDDEGRELPRGEAGELVVRGYNVMTGYFRDAEATAAAIDANGWLHTGDVATMDEAGYVRITDRLKDMFITGGFNAYPAEIEGMMLRHPDVGQVAVIGVPDERMGEVGKAFVVPRGGASVDPDELIEWCRREMANFKVPRFVEVVDELPLNASGKVLKIELRARG
ncbi:MAG: AMP-binding protein [Acidimicrobiia bacterium]|nr:AMP-binding protein [Acidimicrobiia bacterium]